MRSRRAAAISASNAITIFISATIVRLLRHAGGHASGICTPAALYVNRAAATGSPSGAHAAPGSIRAKTWTAASADGSLNPRINDSIVAGRITWSGGDNSAAVAA